MRLSKDDLRRMLAEIKPILNIKDRDERISALEADLAKRGFSSIADLSKALGPRLRDKSVLRAYRALVYRGDEVEQALKTYNEIFSEMNGESWYVFMNHGYASLDDKMGAFPVLNSEDDKWRHQVFLYFYLLNSAKTSSGHASLAGYDLLDVGCGRGGGVSAMKRYYGLGRAIGLDLNPQQIAFCMHRHRSACVQFAEGSALAIPFHAETFQLVSNVESSHCYGDMARFLSEVRRVLKPGGLFLFADPREISFGVPVLETELRNSRMKLLFKEDITARVLHACVLDADRFRYAFGSSKAEFPRRIAERQKEIYSSGALAYRAYVLQKKGSGPSSR